MRNLKTLFIVSFAFLAFSCSRESEVIPEIDAALQQSKITNENEQIIFENYVYEYNLLLESRELHTFFDFRIFEDRNALSNSELNSLINEGYDNMKQFSQSYSNAHDKLLLLELTEDNINRYYNLYLNNSRSNRCVIPNETACLNSILIFAQCGILNPAACAAGVGMSIHCCESNTED